VVVVQQDMAIRVTRVLEDYRAVEVPDLPLGMELQGRQILAVAVEVALTIPTLLELGDQVLS
jgi:hypothetical protein